MSPAEIATLAAYLDHDTRHPGAVAWLAGEGQAGTRAMIDKLTGSGHLERGLFGLRRISDAGRQALADHRRVA